MTNNGLIPYTHWSYFTDRVAAETCGRELDVRFDCLTAVDRALDDVFGLGDAWLLRAARTVDLDSPVSWHDEIEEVVERYGGTYDFGEATLFVPPPAGREAP